MAYALEERLEIESPTTAQRLKESINDLFM
jgi:hypothetical protein